ncbi:hypothetical protein BH09ACT7_BH09ACT7_21130 [soil metagenome]
MTETPFTVDLTQLRTVANEVDRAAEAMVTQWLPGCDEDLPGSAVAGAANPGPITARLDELRSMMTAWAAAVRGSATAFGETERANAARIGS